MRIFLISSILSINLLSIGAFASKTSQDNNGRAKEYQVCNTQTVSSKATSSFRRTSSDFFSSIFRAAHSTNDFITNTETDVSIDGKFAYGKLSKDLKYERVEVYMDNCSGKLKLLGSSLTDRDGRSHVVLTKEELPAAGEYSIFQKVVGDGTFVKSTLRVLPKKTKIVLFDIDGTLTSSDSELWKEMGSNLIEQAYTQEARDAAADATRIRANQGYQIVYLTGRHYYLTDITRVWLNDMAVASGTLQVAQTLGEVWPGNSGVGAYKLSYINRLKKLGFEISAAYGNATTDIYAYEKAGVAKEQTFITGEHSGEEGTVDLGEDYVDHNKEISLLAKIEQPYDQA